MHRRELTVVFSYYYDGPSVRRSRTAATIAPMSDSTAQAIKSANRRGIEFVRSKPPIVAIVAPPASRDAAVKPAAVPTRSGRRDSAPLLATGIVNPLPTPINRHGPKKARASVDPHSESNNPISMPVQVRRGPPTSVTTKGHFAAKRPRQKAAKHEACWNDPHIKAELGAGPAKQIIDHQRCGHQRKGTTYRASWPCTRCRPKIASS